MKINQTITLRDADMHGAFSGAECVFVPGVRNTTCKSSPFHRMSWGLKVYDRAMQAEHARLMQVHFWEHDFAPESGELVRVKFRGDNKTYYGYFTEVIQGKTAESYMPSPCKARGSLPLQFDLAIVQLKRLGYTDLDDHLENIMLCQRRMRWIAVDFGAYSSWKK
jgi:hypothetical protein